MRPRTGLIIVLLLVLVSATAPIVAPDGTGSGISNARGYFLLSPAGSLKDYLHAYLSDMGLPVNVGDTVLFTYRANNGSGPAIYFEIHAHPTLYTYIPYYNTTSREVDNHTWTVPSQSLYMVYFKNLVNATVNVTYSFTLILGQPNYWPLYVAPVGMLAVGVAGAVAVVIARRKRSRP